MFVVTLSLSKPASSIPHIIQTNKRNILWVKPNMFLVENIYQNRVGFFQVYVHVYFGLLQCTVEHAGAGEGSSVDLREGRYVNFSSCSHSDIIHVRYFLVWI